MRKIKGTVILAAVFAATVLLGGCGGAKVGIVDVSKVMSDSPKVKGFQDQLNTKAKALSDELEKQKASLSKEDFQKKQEASYSDFLKTKQDLEGQVDASMKQALEQVAKSKNLDVILYKNSVASGGTDVTDDVIKQIQ